MSLEDPRRDYSELFGPRFDVDVDGETFRDADGVISDLVVETVVDGADHFSFTLNYRFDLEDREFSGLDWDLFRTGAKVEVAMGYEDRREPMIVGRTTSVRPHFPSEEGPTVDVSGYGLLHDMTRGTRSRSWDETTDSDVAREVASSYDFDELDVEETGVNHRKIIQDDENDYRFLKALADRNGFELFARRDTLHFRAPKYGSDPTLTLRYGESIRSVSPEINDAEQVAEVEVRHWDPKEKKEIVGSAERDGARTGKEVLTVPVRSREEADRVAEAALDRISEGLVGGNGEIVGDPTLRAGETLRLEGLGSRFTGTYYVEGATHRMGSSGYTTTFQLKERAI